jgi:hypothetical protein
MLLKEMWSPIGSPKEEEQGIDWVDDLKFFINNDDKMLTTYFFPAVKKHKDHVGNINAYKIYIRPIEKCLQCYCDQYKVDDIEDKFPKDKLIELAKNLASEQEKFIKKGDYNGR